MTTVRWWWEFEEYKEAVVMNIDYYRAGGCGPPDFGDFYKAVVQATLMFGTETWVMHPRTGRTLGRFYHRVVLRLEK